MKPSLQPPPVVTHRGFASTRHQLAHPALQVQELVGRYDEATWQLLARLGYGPRRMANERRRLMALEQKIVHLEEVRTATVLHIESDLLDLGDTSVRCLHRLCDSESQRTLSTMELCFVLIGSDEGSATTLPADLVRRALKVFPLVSRGDATLPHPRPRRASLALTP
jgi:acyl-CoA thioester hydrolase